MAVDTTRVAARDSKDGAAPRILLLIPTRSYRARAFLRAARQVGARVVIGSEREAPLRPRTTGTLTVPLRDPERAVETIVSAALTEPFDAIVGVDDGSTLVAAMAAQALGLPHNDPEAVHATRDKSLMRRLLYRSEALSPWFRTVPFHGDLAAVAGDVEYPCVLKPLSLSASRGVIRANTPEQFLAAAGRIEAILDAEEELPEEERRAFLVEGYIPGDEVALEGMLDRGALRVLALFDKPDPLTGPYFEETIYLTPSRLPDAEQERVIQAVRDGVAALGLVDGPVHAEVRVNHEGAWIVEIAARSIGGLCSSVLEFSGGRSLEQLLLLHAVGAHAGTSEREAAPAGVMMIPTPGGGVLRAVSGLDEARAVPCVTSIEISVPLGDRLVPLPEGNRYLGFIFARGESLDQVEAALREAHARLVFTVTDADQEPVEDMVALPVG